MKCLLAILKGPEGPVSNAVAKVLRCEARRAASGSHIRLERRRLLAALHNSHAPQADWLHVRSYITCSRGAALRTACFWSMMLVLRQTL